MHAATSGDCLHACRLLGLNEWMNYRRGTTSRVAKHPTWTGTARWMGPWTPQHAGSSECGAQNRHS
eukprot:364232-Chlamydomonas_euryale.AAC.12